MSTNEFWKECSYLKMKEGYRLTYTIPHLASKLPIHQQICSVEIAEGTYVFEVLINSRVVFTSIQLSQFSTRQR